MTDGEDMSHSTDDLPQHFHDKYGDCARGCSDPILSSVEVKAFNDTEILAIYSGYSPEGKDALYQMSSCVDYSQDVDQCLYFAQVDDFADLRQKTANITQKIVDSISREHVQCVKGPWLGFLLLLIPLALMLLLPTILRMFGALKTITKSRIVNEKPLIPPPPPPHIARMYPSESPPPKRVEKRVTKAYKWEVDTGAYIRSGGNIVPEWGKYVPESAPTTGSRRKITVGE